MLMHLLVLAGRDGRDSVHSLFGRDEACQVGERGCAHEALP